MRVKINLEPFKDEIVAAYLGGSTQEEICRTLQADHGVECKVRTLARRLNQDWNVKKLERKDVESLRTLIKIYFFDWMLEDEEMALLLRDEHGEISGRTLRRIRIRMGLRRRVLTTDRETSDAAMRQVLQVELDSGQIDGYGRTLLHAYFRHRGFMIGR